MATQYEKRNAKKVEKPAEISAVEPIADKIAYDVFFDEATRSFIKVTLEYNLESGIGKVVNAKPIADSQPVAIRKMGEIINRKILNLPMKEEK